MAKVTVSLISSTKPVATYCLLFEIWFLLSCMQTQLVPNFELPDVKAYVISLMIFSRYEQIPLKTKNSNEPNLLGIVAQYSWFPNAI